MGQSYKSRRIFLPGITISITRLDFPKCGHILGKTLWSGPRYRPGRQAHGSTRLASRHHVWCPGDFLGLINTSDEPCGKQWAFLGVPSSHFSSVSRGVRSAWSIFIGFSLAVSRPRFSRCPIFVVNFYRLIFSTIRYRTLVNKTRFSKNKFLPSSST